MSEVLREYMKEYMRDELLEARRIGMTEGRAQGMTEGKAQGKAEGIIQKRYGHAHRRNYAVAAKAFAVLQGGGAGFVGEIRIRVGSARWCNMQMEYIR